MNISWKFLIKFIIFLRNLRWLCFKIWGNLVLLTLFLNKIVWSIFLYFWLKLPQLIWMITWQIVLLLVIFLFMMEENKGWMLRGSRFWMWRLMQGRKLIYIKWMFWRRFMWKLIRRVSGEGRLLLEIILLGQVLRRLIRLKLTEADIIWMRRRLKLLMTRWRFWLRIGMNWVKSRRNKWRMIKLVNRWGRNR